MEDSFLKALNTSFEKQSLLEQDIQEFQRSMSQTSNNFASYISFGAALQQKNQHEQAIKVYNAAIQRSMAQTDKVKQSDLEINWSELYNGLGLSLHALGKLEEAITAYNNSLRFDPSNQATYLNLALALYKQGDIDGAANVYSKIVKPNFQQLPAYYTLSIGLGREDNLDVVANICKAEINADPSNVNAYFTLGLAFKSQGNLKEAAEAFGAAIQLNPLFINAYNNVGNVLSEMGELESAIKIYNDAIQIYPDNIDTHYNLGVVYEKQKKIEQAIKAYERVLQINPKDYSCLIKLGQVFLKQGSLQKAEDSFRKAINIRPRHSPAYIELGIVLYNQNKLEESISTLHLVLQLDANNNEIKFYYHFGLALHKKKDLVNAEKMFNKVIRLNNCHLDAHLKLGLVFYDQGKIKEASQVYNKALEFHPKSSVAYNGLGLIYCKQGNLKESIQAFETAIKLDPSNIQSYNNLGISLVKLGKLQEAIAVYNRGIQLDPENILCYCNRGKILNQLGKETEALMDFNKAYELLQDETINMNLSVRNKNYISETLSNERREALDKLANLHQGAIMIEKLMDSHSSFNEEEKTRFSLMKTGIMKLTNEMVDTVQQKDNESVQLDRLQKEMQKMKEMNQQLQQMLLEHGKKVDRHNNVLQNAGVFTKERIKEEFRDLSVNNPELFKYCNTFYWVLLNYLAAYRSLATKLMNGNYEDEKTQTEKIIHMTLKKVTGISSLFLDKIPFLNKIPFMNAQVAGVALLLLDNVIDYAIDSRTEERFHKKVKAINTIIVSNQDVNVLLEEDLSMICASTALKIVKSKPIAQQVVSLTAQASREASDDLSIDQKMVNPSEAAKKKLQKLTKTVLSSMNYSGSLTAEEAITDIASLLSYLYGNTEEVVQSGDPLDVQFAEIVVQRKWENMERANRPADENGPRNKNKCNMF